MSDFFNEDYLIEVPDYSTVMNHTVIPSRTKSSREKTAFLCFVLYSMRKTRVVLY